MPFQGIQTSTLRVFLRLDFLVFSAQISQIAGLAGPATNPTAVLAKNFHLLWQWCQWQSHRANFLIVGQSYVRTGDGAEVSLLFAAVGGCMPQTVFEFSISLRKTVSSLIYCTCGRVRACPHVCVWVLVFVCGCLFVAYLLILPADQRWKANNKGENPNASD